MDNSSMSPTNPAPPTSGTHAERLPRSFYERPAATVARELLGCVLAHRDAEGVVRRARIVETEAYIGPEDLACHASKGRTRRTEIMFGEGGHAYIYLIYGMHHLFNVVTGAVDEPAAVLVRACVAIENCEGPLSGPGLVCRSLGIDMSHYGDDLLGDRLWIEARHGKAPKVVSGPRIGVDYAGDWAAKPLRYAVDQEREVSRPRPFVLARKGKGEGRAK